MTAKEYLSGVQKFNVTIEQKEKEKQWLMNLITTKFPKDKNRILHLIGVIEEEITGISCDRQRIIDQIQGLNNVLHMNVLFKRYVSDQNIFLISESMNYSEQYIKEVHGKALKAFENAYQDIFNKEGISENV